MTGWDYFNHKRICLKGTEGGVRDCFDCDRNTALPKLNGFGPAKRNPQAIGFNQNVPPSKLFSRIKVIRVIRDQIGFSGSEEKGKKGEGPKN
jgi:hypothetical protein